MKLLVIEDEDKLGDYLRSGLTQEGFVVDLVRDGVDGLHQASEGAYDLVLLDGVLPGIDGLAVLAALRQQDHTRGLPVLMMTARAEVEDRVRGLQAGADDYLCKPFAFSELVARIQALVRRAAGTPPAEATVLKLADLEVDLLRRQGQVLSRTELAEQVWDMNFDSETNVVEVAVRRLRGKLDKPFDLALLHTVRGMGYVLEAREPQSAP